MLCERGTREDDLRYTGSLVVHDSPTKLAVIWFLRLTLQRLSCHQSVRITRLVSSIIQQYTAVYSSTRKRRKYNILSRKTVPSYSCHAVTHSRITWRSLLTQWCTRALPMDRTARQQQTRGNRLKKNTATAAAALMVSSLTQLYDIIPTTNYQVCYR